MTFCAAWFIWRKIRVSSVNKKTAGSNLVQRSLFMLICSVYAIDFLDQMSPGLRRLQSIAAQRLRFGLLRHPAFFTDRSAGRCRRQFRAWPSQLRSRPACPPVHPSDFLIDRPAAAACVGHAEFLCFADRKADRLTV